MATTHALAANERHERETSSSSSSLHSRTHRVSSAAVRLSATVHKFGRNKTGRIIFLVDFGFVRAIFGCAEGALSAQSQQGKQLLGRLLKSTARSGAVRRVL